jgi:tyrosinase
MSGQKGQKGKKGKKSVKEDNPCQDSINEFLRVPKDFRKDQARVKNHVGFSPFDRDQMEQAAELCATLMEIANNNPDDPIEKVLEYSKEQNNTTDPELVRWALMNFITHHPSARNKNLRIPSLVMRAPEIAIPKKKKKNFNGSRSCRGI